MIQNGKICAHFSINTYKFHGLIHINGYANFRKTYEEIPEIQNPEYSPYIKRTASNGINDINFIFFLGDGRIVSTSPDFFIHVQQMVFRNTSI